MMRSLRSTLLVLTATVAFLPFLTSNATIVVATDQSPSDDAILTADMIGAQEALAIAEQSEQLGNTDATAYGYTEVDYAIRELMVASDVSFLGFDCAILTTLGIGYAQITPVISGFNFAVFRPSSGTSANSVSTANFASALNVRRTDHNS